MSEAAIHFNPFQNTDLIHNSYTEKLNWLCEWEKCTKA